MTGPARRTRHAAGQVTGQAGRGAAGSFGAWLKRVRAARDVTQAELGRLLGYATELVRALEGRRRRASRDSCGHLAEFLGVPGVQHEAFVQWARMASGRNGVRLPVPAWIEALCVEPLPRGPAFLPAPATRLIGRARDVAAATARLLDAGVRLLTLTGAPGIGKTRLAIQVAHEVAHHFPGGVFFVELAATADPGLVASAIAQRLRVSAVGQQTPEERVLEVLRDRQALLVLDNLEHVLPAGALVGRLLEGAPRLKVLVTSRAALHLYGEHVWEVPPLPVPALDPLPPLEMLAQVPSVALFVERAGAVQPGFELTTDNARAVAAIGVRLDGLPLAIELAAAGCRRRSASEVLTGLEGALDLLTEGPANVPDRLRTMRGAIAWSHRLLDEGTQVVFGRVAVFAGGCSPASATDVCGDRGGASSAAGSIGDVAAHLEGLVRAGLLQRHAGEGGDLRYILLEAIRAFALEQLRQRGEEEALRQRHAIHYVALAERLVSERAALGVEAWLDRMEQEHNNFRAALDWAGTSGDTGLALRLTGALGEFWELRGHWAEGRGWLERALQGSSDSPPAWRATALYHAATLAARNGGYEQALSQFRESLAIRQEAGDTAGSVLVMKSLGYLAKVRGDLAAAERHFSDGLAMARQAGDGRGMAFTLEGLGYMAADEGHYEMAQACLEASLAQWRELDDRWGASNSLEYLGLLASYQGDYGTARHCFDESLTIRRDVGDRWRVANSLHNLGRVVAAQGDYGAAREYLEESLAICRALTIQHGIALALNGLGEVALAEDDRAQAVEQCEAALVLWRGMNYKRGTADCLHVLGLAAQQTGEWHRAAALATESLALRHGERNKRGIAASLTALAGPVAARGQPERAVRMLGAAAALLASVGAALRAVDRAQYDGVEAAVSAELGQQRFAVAWEEGREAALEAVIEDALRE